MKPDTNTMMYHMYKLPISRFIRILLVLFLLVVSTFEITKYHFPHGPFFLLSLFILMEVFYRYKIFRLIPQISVRQIKNDEYLSFTMQALDIFLFSQNIQQLLKNLILTKSIRFILHKTNIVAEELTKTNLTKEMISKKAIELVIQLNGKYVTRMDLFVAYLLLTEPETHLLFSKHLKVEEVIHILSWARFEFPQEESPSKKRIVFYGEGLFDNFMSGWSLETAKYTSDITDKVLVERPILFGRRKEFELIVSILSRPYKQNALLVGEPGSGKNALVEALALDCYLGNIKGTLSHKRVYELMISQVIAGVKEMGDLEMRLQNIIEEISHAGNVILFIADLENILGSQTFHLDLSGLLIPYLRGKHVPIIATISTSAYRNFVEPMDAFSDLFEVVRVDALGKEEAIQMLLEKANEIEDKNHVTITFKAIISAVDLSSKYLQNKVLPGSAVSLLNATSASKLGRNIVIDEADVVAKIEEKTQVTIATPGESEKNLLLHLEDKLHERIINQLEAVTAISEALRRLRSGITIQNRPISFLFLGPTGVGKTETAKALASVYFGGEEKIIRLDMSEYTNADSVNRLLGSSPGRGTEKGELTEKVYEHPFSLILLDEFEKAHAEILDLFLQVLEDGRLTDNHGKTVSFINTIIIATSNAGALFILNSLQHGSNIDKEFKSSLLDEVEKEHLFKPELLNRFDDIIVFHPLGQSDIQMIAQQYLQKLVHKLKDQDIQLDFDPSVITLVAKEGFDSKFGARPLRRFIQDNIEDAVARAMLEGTIARGSHIYITFDGNQTLRIVQKNY